VTTKIEVRLDAMTLMGRDNKPGDLPGYGPISSEYAQELAFQPGSFWYRFLTDPLSGIVVDHGRTRYRPPVALGDLVKARDVRCCGVGCHRPASTCEIDHSVSYPAGKTSDDNLAPACKYHNLAKLHGWSVEQTSPGHFKWTSPTGRTYDVFPENDPAPLGPPPFSLRPGGPSTASRPGAGCPTSRSGLSPGFPRRWSSAGPLQRPAR
jgi:hypothetical protein